MKTGILKMTNQTLSLVVMSLVALVTTIVSQAAAAPRHERVLTADRVTVTVAEDLSLRIYRSDKAVPLKTCTFFNSEAAAERKTDRDKLRHAHARDGGIRRTGLLAGPAGSRSPPPAGGDSGIAIEEGRQRPETPPAASLSIFGRGDILRGNRMPAKERNYLQHRHDGVFGRDGQLISSRIGVTISAKCADYDTVWGTSTFVAGDS